MILGSSSRSLGCRLITFTRSKTNRALQTFGKVEYDIKSILANYDRMRESIELKRLNKGTLIKELNFIRDNYHVAAELGKEIGELKKIRSELNERIQSNPSTSKDEVKKLKIEIRRVEKQRADLLEIFHSSADNFPTLVGDGVTDKEQLVELINCESVEAVEEAADKKALSHKLIGQQLGILDLETASRVCGHAFYYLVGDGALLEQALVQYALAKARSRGYKMVIPPSLVREEVVAACGFKPRDKGGENQIYSINKEDLNLTATAEISIAALELKKVFANPEEQLPLKYAGVSRSYRAEAGARGATTAGIYRVHEFTKVELFHFTTPETAWEQLEQLKEFQVEVVKELGLTAKVLNMPGSDLGFPAAAKYDIECWMPGRKTWGEITSSSYCRDYQARRMNIKYKSENGNAFVHTLNGTAMAVPRVIVAIIENNWDPKTESILIPEVLRPYMGGIERIYKQQ